MSITVRLILNSHFPEKNGVWDEEDFESLAIIKLNGKNISQIDNLELFHQITELHLKDNNISTVENIGILPHLRVLDLSNNNIGEDGFEKESLPLSLRELNISGNPCADSPVFLEKFQISLPHVMIITEADASDSPSSPTTDSTVDCRDGILTSRKEDDAASLAAIHRTVLTSEEILREVVDRKCRLQSYSQFNLDSAIKDLDSEYSHTITRSRRPNNRSTPSSPEKVRIGADNECEGKQNCSSIPDHPEPGDGEKHEFTVEEHKVVQTSSRSQSNIPFYEERLQQLMQHADNCEKMHRDESDFMTRLRAKALETQQKAFEVAKICDAILNFHRIQQLAQDYKAAERLACWFRAFNSLKAHAHAAYVTYVDIYPTPSI